MKGDGQIGEKRLVCSVSGAYLGFVYLASDFMIFNLDSHGSLHSFLTADLQRYRFRS